MFKTKTHFFHRIGWQYHVVGLLILLSILRSLLTSSASAQFSALHSNCLGTGGLAPSLTTFLNTKFISTWTTQNKCLGNVSVSVVASGDLLSGNVMQYNVMVTNNGPRWAYGSQVSFTGTNGLIASGGTTLTYNILAPGSSQTLSLFVNKSATTSSGIVTSTATFTLVDPTINDTATGNNTAVQNPIVRGSTRAVCYNPALNVPNYECDALMDLYTSTNGAGWTNKTNWGSGTDIEAWFGITLTTVGGKQYVRDICLSNTVEGTACNYQYQGTAGNNMSGPLPSSIGVFSELTKLALSNNALGGIIPVELTNLKKASIVLLASTNLTGSLPTTIGNMTALSQLDIAGNNLGGALPTSLNTTALTILRASSNKFTSLPDLSSRSLSQLQLHDNLLSGPLPTWIGSESLLEFVRLSDNDFTGPIPASWAGLTSLGRLYLFGNQLTGSLQVFSGLNANLINEFQVHNNNLDRDSNNNAIVPTNIQARLAGMTSQNLTNQGDITPPVISGTGMITATIAGEFTYTLTVAENGSTTGAGFATGLPIFFTGSSVCIQSLYTTGVVTNRLGNTTIQVYVLELGTFAGCQIGIRDRANLASNLITLPTFLNNDYGVCNSATDVPKSDCRSLMDLYTSTAGANWTNKTNWKGSGDATPTTICDWFGIQCSGGRVSGICLNALGNTCSGGGANAGNNLSGTLPASLTNLTGLVSLMLQNNYLTGQMPTISNITTLQNLYVQGSTNRLNGPLPAVAPGIRNMYLNDNQFTGPIPASYCSITALGQLYLNNNPLNTTLPSCLPTFNGTSVMGISNAGITGSLPSWNSSTIKILQLNNNNISGPIPSSFASMTGLTVLDLSNNGLRGFIPEGLTSLINLTNSGSNLNNNCLSPSPTYMSAGLQTTLNTKFNNRGTQSNCPGTISDSVWLDANNNGIQDGGETGTGNVTVTLRRCADQTSTGGFNLPISYVGSSVASATTNSAGVYSFASVGAHYTAATVNSGKYYLEFTSIPNGYKFSSQFASSNWQSTTDSNINPWSAKTDCFELYNGLTVSGVDAGLKYLPYASCDTVTANYTPVLVGQQVTVTVAGYGQNAQVTLYRGANPADFTQTLNNQGTNWALKTWITSGFVPTWQATYIISGSVDGSTDKLEYYESVSSAQAYRVVGTNQRCAVSQANLGPQTMALTTINQIATIPAPISYCTGGQGGLPFAAVNNQPPKMLVKLPSCTSTLAATTDTNMLCDYVTDMNATECKELVKLYDATEGRVQCANEGSNCNFAGTRQVRYGNGGAYRYLTGTTLLSCNNATFGGDPVQGIGKKCRYKMDTGTWTTSTNWKFVGDTTPRTACDWYGVSCVAGGVTTINLASNNLQRSLTGINWSVFTDLTNLELYDNDLVGNLPDVSGANSLQVLRLGFNQFTGTLPSQWSTIPSLTTISLANAGVFTGAIPVSWSGLINLEQLHLSNTLTGARAFPTIISSRTKLRELHLDNNGMTGAIPSSLFTLTGLQSLQLQNNDLYGDLSAQNWSALTNLYTSAYGGTKSALDNNCLYTGRVSGATGAFLDARFNFTSSPTTDWRNQKMCNTDLQMTSYAAIGNLMTGVSMSFVLDYMNLGPIPSYNPIITIQLASGLNLTVSGNFTAGRTTGVRIADLAPGQTGQYTFTINKTQLGSGFWPGLINVFRIDDPTRSDSTGSNNLITNSMDARGSSYPVCIHPNISVQTYECEALGDLYTFTNGSGWTTKTNWMISPDIESWHGISLVTLTGVNYVQKICLADETEADTCNNPSPWGNANGNGLSGSLQFTIGDLAQLTTLALSQNNITGSLPAQMTNLDKVTQLKLYNTKVSNLGTGVAGMSGLQTLALNGSTGLTSLPSNFGQAPSLQTVHLFDNGITSLPDLSGLADTVFDFNLDSNPLANTTLPIWLSGFTNMRYLSMSNTQLTGQIGTILDNLPQLLSFTLNNNNLTGSLPALTNSRKLQSISLVNNKLSGILPTSWSVLTGMTQINLQTNNGLTGTLPSSWSGMRLLQTLNLSGGSWFGQIPSSWFPVMTGMRDFIIPNGSLDGPVPATGFQLWPLLRTGPITSSIVNNCMYTGLVNGVVATWMDTYVNWATQRKCDANLQLSLVSKSAVDYNPGKTITYTITYTNNGPRWSYEPKISIDLFTGLMLSGTTSRTGMITLPILQPGQTGQIIITANKRGTGSGVVTYTNTFTIADTTTIDSITGNNTLVDSGAMRLFKYNECIDVTDVPQIECEALMDIYTFTNGTSWTTKTNWAGFSDTTLCDWYGVTCSGGRVTNLCLAGSTAGTQCQDAWTSPGGNNLSGTLLSTIGDLTELTGLFLGDNNINGAIPTQINNLTKLQNLSLGDNKFTSLPTLTGLQQLIWLHVGINQIAGPLPAWLGQMPQLSGITLFSNLFTGPLPTSWTGASKLRYLSIGNNPITNAVLPTQWSSWSSLRELYIAGSQLTGSLPTSWSSLTGLTKLNLSANYFNGSLPTSWTGMRSLQVLNLGGNQFNGSLPAEWSSLTGLADLRLYGNPFVGATLPSSWSALANLQTLDLSSSQLSGILPSSWSALVKLQTLNISSNNFTDEIPSSWFTGMKMLQSLGVSSNSLAGPINTLQIQSLTGLVSNNSTIMNNCLYTGAVVGGYIGWMDTYFTTSWRTQRKCNADIQLTGMSVVGDMMSGAFMTYTFTYNNLGPSRAYLPRVNVTLYTGFIFVNGGGSTTGINLGYLKPYTSGSLTIPIAKIAVGSGVVPFTNTFVISDTTSNDLSTGNNTIIHTGTLKLFKYPICGSITDISQAECEALGDFYTFTNGSGWTTKTNWMGFGDATSNTACDWFGVSCTTLTGWISPKTVDKLCMSHSNTGAMCNYGGWEAGGVAGNNLSGTLQSTIGDLVNMIRFTVTQNTKIVGSIPSSLGSLSKLQVLSMFNTKFTGQIPSSFGSLTALTQLALAGNTLNGPIPSNLFMLPSLSIVHMYGMGVSGPIPSTGTSPLGQLQLYNNNLTGSIPSWITTKTTLSWVGLEYNKLSGPLPTNWTGGVNVSILTLNNNQFTGSIPTGWTFTKLTTLNLSNNTGLATGSIPSWILNNTGLITLDVNNTNLTGALPSSWSALTKLTTLKLNNNNLNGEIPSSWSALTGLTAFTIANNNIDGLIPSWINTAYPSLGANSSTMSNNCMYTGFVSGSLLSYMNSKFGSNWQTQKICSTDLILGTITVSGSLNTGNTLIYTINYSNGGTRWLYNPKIAIKLSTGLAIGSTTGTFTGTLGALAPGQAGVSSFFVNKNYFTGVGLSQFTNSFTLSDPSISDTNSANNTFTHTGTVRGSNYPICVNSSLTIPQDDCEALMDLYLTTNGSSWVNKTNRGVSADVDTWFGVTVTNGRVAKINLSNTTDENLPCSISSGSNNLSGTLPLALSNLTAMTSLCLGNNQLIGTLPVGVLSLTSLQTLSLHHNNNLKLQGAISGMTSLQTFDMSNSMLSGTLANIIGILPGIRYIYLNNNQITGGISQISSYSNLQGVRLNNNLLTGSLPTTLSSLSFLTELMVNNNLLDRDDVNNALVPSSLVNRYNSISLRSRANQGDITAPILSGTISISPAITGGLIPITFSINENSYVSGSYTAGSYSGQSVGGLYLTVTGAGYCSNITSDLILSHTGSVTVAIYPETDAQYVSCQIAVRDRANNISNYLTLPTFTYTQLPYRLHIRFSGSGVVLNNAVIQSVNDLSSFANVITMAGGSPAYIPLALNDNPAVQFNNGQSLMMPGIFRKQVFNDANILMVVKPGLTNSSLLFEQAQGGTPVVLTTNSWSVGSNTVSFSLPTTAHSLITASHSNGGQHQVRINGAVVSTTATNQPLQVSGISITTIGSGLGLGMLGEAIVYTKSLSGAALTYLESYLALKYGITLPSDYLAVLANGSVGTIWSANPTYQYQVVGLGHHLASALPIGQTSSSSSSGAAIALHARGTWSDGQYVVVGSTSDDVMNRSRTIPSLTGYKTLPRTWYVQKTGNPSFDISITDTSIADFNFAPTIFVSNSPTFSTITTSGELILSGTKWITPGITIASGQYFTFGIGQSNMGGRVWLDTNRDGIQSPSEPSIAGVKARIWKCPARQFSGTGPWYVGSGATGSILLDEQTTTTGITNYLFVGLNAGDYYMTYDRSQAVLHPADTTNQLVSTIDSSNNPGLYNGGPTWSDYEMYYPWSISKGSLWYGSMTSISGIDLKTIDSDLISSTYPNYQTILPQSSQCYTIRAGATQSSLGAGLTLSNSTDLSITQTVNPTSVDNVSGSQFNLTVTANNNGSVRSHYTQIVVQLPVSTHVLAVTNLSGNQSMPYVVSGSKVKLYIGAFNANVTSSYRIDMSYDGSEDDGTGLPFSSTIMSTTVDSNTSNNTSTNGTLTLIRKGASIGNLVWIDTNGNGIQDSDELANSFAAGVIVELHDTTTNALVKPQKQSSSTGLYLFNSVPVGTYRIFATNLPKGFVFTNTGIQGQSTAVDSNINSATNMSDIITVTGATDNLSIDIGLKSIDPLNLCSNTQSHKLRMGVPYSLFADTYTVSSALGVRLLSADRIWTEVANHNESDVLPTLQLYNNGRGLLPWGYMAPGATQTILSSNSPSYTATKAPLTRALTGQMIISYNYLGCYVSTALPTYCQQGFRYNSCHTYEITACGDGVIDAYSTTGYIGTNWGYEECDNGIMNDGITIVNGAKCKADCMINRDNVADLAITKRDIVRNLCTLNPGSDGIGGGSGSITASGNRAVPVSGSTGSFISISN